MNCVLHVMLTLKQPSFPDIKVGPCFYFMSFADHITSPSIIKNIIDSTEGALML